MSYAVHVELHIDDWKSVRHQKYCLLYPVADIEVDNWYCDGWESDSNEPLIEFQKDSGKEGPHKEGQGCQNEERKLL